MYRKADSPLLEKILTSYFGTDKTGTCIGNGGLANALRYEKQTGVLLSDLGRAQKTAEMRSRLNNFIKKADNQNPESYPNTLRDIEHAHELLRDLNNALKR